MIDDKFHDDLSAVSLENNDKYTQVIKTSKKSNVTKDNIFEIMLMQIPGVSSIVAEKINNNFKNMKNYKKLVYEFYSNKYINKTNIHNHIKEILETSYHTWDLYQVNYILLILIKIHT